MRPVYTQLPPVHCEPEVEILNMTTSVIVRRRCAADGCGTILRRSNYGEYCAVCERKSLLRELRAEKTEGES